MSFVLDCPACGKAITATRDLIGRVMACPHCARHFTLPGEGQPPVRVIAPTYHPTSDASRIRFTFTCERCSSVLEAHGEVAGTRGKCPTCGAVFTIPQVDPRTGLPLGPAVVDSDGQLPTPMHAYATAGDKAPTIRRLEDGQQVILCPRCGRQMSVEANNCASCGMPFTMEGAEAIAYAGPNSNGLATAALVIGILSLLSFCSPILGPVAIGLGLGGLKRAKKISGEKNGRKMAIAGLICGLLSICIFATLQLI